MSNKIGNLTIWLNVHKKDDDIKAPDYRGKLEVSGESMELSLWINRDVRGVPVHLSGQIIKAKSEG